MTESKKDMTALHMFLFFIVSMTLVFKYYSRDPKSDILVANPSFSVFGPYNITKIAVQDNYTQLINIKNFSFKINPQPCKKYPAGLLLIVIVSSNPRNHRKRNIIRHTWGKNFDSTKVVFLVGEPENINIYNQVLKESRRYGDIVQGNFVDVYRNLTYKHVMGLKWVAHHCPVAKYVLKSDDDVVVNSRALSHFLTRELSPWGVKNLITCQVFHKAHAQRSENLKWRVTMEEYPSKYYPTYCAGWAVLYSQDVIPQLLKAAQDSPYFWIDDVHITGVCAEKVGIDRTPLSSLILSQARGNMLTMLGPKYVGPFLFGPRDLSYKGMKQIWKAIPQ